MVKILAVLVGILVLLGIGLWLAVRANGPAVLDTVDRIAGPSNGVALVETARYGDIPEQKLRVYRDETASGPLPVFIFYHGGAWAHGDPDDYGFIARNIAPEGYVVVLGGYRMNEAGRYPAMLQDTASVIAWTRTNIAQFGGNPDQIVLSGHSAGAYNAVQVALDKQWLDDAGVPMDAIRGVVGLSGPYDFYPFDTDRSKAAFESVGAGPESQPVNQPLADAPPMLLIHGEADTIVKIRNSQALARGLDEAGSQVDTLYLSDASHNAPLLALTSPWRRDPQVFDQVMQFLRRNTDVSVPVQAAKP